MVSLSENAAFENISSENITFLEYASSESSHQVHAQTKTDVESNNEKQLVVEKCLLQYRLKGHLAAKTTPQSITREYTPVLLDVDVGQGGLFPTYGLLEKKEAPLSEIVEALESIYCDKVGYEFWPFCDDTSCRWLSSQIEQRGTEYYTQEKKCAILQKLIEAEAFETFLHMRYTGQKRFSLEGAETLVVMLSELIEQTSSDSIILGMSHRGRLNVMVNLLDKSYRDIFSEFEDIEADFEGSGDVKYHKGYSCKKVTGEKTKHIILAANPSHLESVGSVVEGMARATKNALPVVVHGDAAFSGQGIVYETLQLSKLASYSVGGTVHIIINNHIGFTTLPEDSRSTTYCTDIAKTFGIAVFHVNAEDPESCIAVTKLALAMRHELQTDVIIELNCFRKYGHNESDEPSFTQPLLYRKIRQTPSITALYSKKMIKEGFFDESEIKKLHEVHRKNLQDAHDIKQVANSTCVCKQAVSDVYIETKVSLESLKKCTELLYTVPDGFLVHPRIKQQFTDRLQIGHRIDWAQAEALALATSLQEGACIRFSGQDSRRGTFSQRHGMLIDQNSEEKYFPLHNFCDDKAHFELIDSPLSEYAALGFEYGVSIADTSRLVIWEAQFGDFANGAQVLIDQYIASGEQKWGSRSRLTILLPHGYEGQGPEHSSGRIERFLSLCAKDNLIVCHPTTPAQFFHLLRRQVKLLIPRPLVVFTPKALLRHPLCTSDFEALTSGTFSEVIDDTKSTGSETEIIFCQGKIFYDLIAYKKKECAIIRIEQLYPFPKEQIKEIINKYSKASSFYWVQEEPENMGAWSFIALTLQELLPNSLRLAYRGRAASSSPAVGSHRMHEKEHQSILNSLSTCLEVLP